MLQVSIVLAEWQGFFLSFVFVFFVFLFFVFLQRTLEYNDDMSQPSCKTWNSVDQKLQHKGPGHGKEKETGQKVKKTGEKGV